MKRSNLPISLVIIFGLGGLLLLGVATIRGRGGAESSAGGAAAAAELELGRTVYAQHCAACHGPELEGQPNWKNYNADGTFRAPPHDETGHTWHHGDQYLLERIRYGTDNLDESLKGLSNMPGYAASLRDEEIKAVLIFIKSSWPADIQRVQAERTAAEGQ